MICSNICQRSHVLFSVGLIATLLTGTTVSAGDLEGRWRNGSWTDTNTGHEDALRGNFREKSDGNYKVVFTGRFAKVIPFRFSTTLNVVSREGDKVILAGESRIMGFVKFSYNGVADRCNFHADYCSKRWRGEFNLSR